MSYYIELLKKHPEYLKESSKELTSKGKLAEVKIMFDNVNVKIGDEYKK